MNGRIESSKLTLAAARVFDLQLMEKFANLEKMGKRNSAGCVMKDNLIAVAAATVGGIAGFYAFKWLWLQGFYALVLPGGLLGMAAGFRRNRSILVAVVCGIAATALGIVVESHFRPFVADGSFGYFITHLMDLQSATLLMIAIGGFIGFWVPFRRLERKPVVKMSKTL